jgi:hypothetical protein
MKHPQMLYKLGSRMQWQDRAYDWIIVDANDHEALEAALDDGWCEHPDECQEAIASESAPKRRGRPPKARQ